MVPGQGFSCVQHLTGQRQRRTIFLPERRPNGTARKQGNAIRRMLLRFRMTVASLASTISGPLERRPAPGRRDSFPRPHSSPLFIVATFMRKVASAGQRATLARVTVRRLQNVFFAPLLRVVPRSNKHASDSVVELEKGRTRKLVRPPGS